MCRFYSEHFYLICLHTCTASDLPATSLVLYRECALQRTLREEQQCAFDEQSARHMHTDDPNFHHWEQQLQRCNDVRPPHRRGCYTTEFAPGTLFPFPRTEDDDPTGFSGLCPACHHILHRANLLWQRALDALCAVSEAAPAICAAAAAHGTLHTVHPAIRHLPTNARAVRPLLDAARHDVLAHRGAHSIFMVGLWKELHTYERVLLAGFVLAFPGELPEWETHDRAFTLNQREVLQMEAEVAIVLAEGERLLEAAGQPNPLGRPRPETNWSVDELCNDLFEMEL